MVIAQLVARDASLYDRKHAAIDRAALVDGAIVPYAQNGTTWSAPDGSTLSEAALADWLRATATLVHVYGGPLPETLLRRTNVPYLAATAPTISRLPWRRLAPPATLLAEDSRDALPEAVDDEWFALRRMRPALPTVGSRRRPSTIDIEQATMARVARTRTDLNWRHVDGVATASALRDVTVWFDPTPDPNDRDGMVAEALCAGIPVVASRMPVNESRLDRGAAGQLVRPHPNEFTHALLKALFKPELLEETMQHARMRAERFRKERRLSALSALYRRLAP